MHATGVDSQTGEIFLAEGSSPIRPQMRLDEFMVAFKDLDAFRIDVAGNPFPTCGFGRTFLIADQHFTVTGQFGDFRLTSNPTLRILRLFATRGCWSRKKNSFILRLRRWISPRPWLIGLPPGISTMEAQLRVYESWLSSAVRQHGHERDYAWGKLRLVNSRSECYHLQFEYAQ